MTEPPFDFDKLTKRAVPFRRFDAGEKLFLEDEIGDCMFVVRSGSVEVITFGTMLENIDSGGMFGEMALIEDSPRSAAAIATAPAEVAVIDKPTFVSLVLRCRRVIDCLGQGLDSNIDDDAEREVGVLLDRAFGAVGN